MNSSDSDDFYDAQQDLEPDKDSLSPLLITDESEDPGIGGVKNPNSPCRSGADLSLEHLIHSTDERLVVITDDASSSHDQNQEPVDALSAPAEVILTVEENLPVLVDDLVTQESNDICKEQQIVPSEKVTEFLLRAAVEDTTADAPSHGDPPKLEPSVLPSLPLDEPSAETKVDPCNDIIDTSSKVDENWSESSSKRSSYHQPDIVASIKERPSHLPGVQSFQLTHEQIILSEQKKPPPHVPHPSPARPKRPPPPRPKAPPKRPPLPKGGPQKPFLNSNDDALLTPNSTVDNITREFAAALSDTKRKEDTWSPLESSPAEPTPVRSPAKSTKDQTQKRKDPPLKRHSLSRKLSNQSGGGCLDEERQWSEMRKETVLTIDSSPGLEILSTVIVRNLDTGQTMPLSVAAEQVSQCLNPLALQIMSRTKEFACATAGAEEQAVTSHKPQTPEQPRPLSRVSLEEDSLSVASDEITIGADAASNRTLSDGGRKLRMKSKRLKSFIGKGARKMKNVAGGQMERAVHKVKQSKGDNMPCDSLNVSSDEDVANSMTNSFVKTKSSSSNKDAHHFSRPKLVQDIAVHVGAVWSMKFSHCGRLLATAGQNNVIWVWVLKDYFSFFNNLRSKYDGKERGAVFATPPRNSMDPPCSQEELSQERSGSIGGRTIHEDEADDEEDAPFRSLPFSSYVGHTADVLDLAWSKNYFTLSSSMDKTVRLWHVSQKECLCCFQHIDFVTAISFHPKDDRYFLSGSLDSKLRLWNIPEKKVALWNEIYPDSSAGSSSGGGGALITTVNFCENGKYAVCGTYDGRCMFYDTEHLKYHTQIHVRSSRGRNNKGHKITGIEPLPGEKKILVTSNDSRVRLYDLRDLSLTCKFKGLTNLSSQIKASFSHDSKYIICGSEDKSVYIWRTNPPQDVTKLSSFRRDRNDAWESIRAHDAVVTCAIFAPYPHLMARNSEKSESGSKTSLLSGKKGANSYIISADFNGLIKVFSNSHRK